MTTTDPFSGDQYRQLLDTAPDAIVVADHESRILVVNRQTETLFGYTRDELLGRQLDLLIPTLLRHRHGDHVKRYFEAPTLRSMGSGLELHGLRKDGFELPIEVSLSPLRTDAGWVVSAAIRDITDRKRMDDELRRARHEAEAGSAAKSEFVASMSHELRTPLNAILGFAQLARRDKKEPLPPRHTVRLDQILRGGEHLLRLIDDILDLARIEAGGVAISSERVDLVQVVGEVKATLETAASRAQVEVVVTLDEASLPAVVADRTRVTQILINFGTNAIKYNRAGGHVQVVVSRSTASALRVLVRDDGLGVPADKRHALFQPFQRAGQETGPIEGTGIGLVISKRLAELMQGTVGYRPAPGGGSEFWVDLPVDVGQAPVAVVPAGRSGRLEHAAGAILYVEDNPANVVFMEDLLSAFEGIELLVATDAKTGIELARTRLPKVILMDINLPGMSGLEALAQLRQDPMTRRIPVIALTAAASERDRRRGEQAGFYRYLTKPVQVAELEETLQGLLDG